VKYGHVVAQSEIAININAILVGSHEGEIGKRPLYIPQDGTETDL
jgi:hypothetical protein